MHHVLEVTGKACSPFLEVKILRQVKKQSNKACSRKKCNILVLYCACTVLVSLLHFLAGISKIFLSSITGICDACPGIKDSILLFCLVCLVCLVWLVCLVCSQDLTRSYLHSLRDVESTRFRTQQLGSRLVRGLLGRGATETVSIFKLHVISRVKLYNWNSTQLIVTIWNCGTMWNFFAVKLVSQHFWSIVGSALWVDTNHTLVQTYLTNKTCHPYRISEQVVRCCEASPGLPLLLHLLQPPPSPPGHESCHGWPPINSPIAVICEGNELDK